MTKAQKARKRSKELTIQQLVAGYFNSKKRGDKIDTLDAWVRAIQQKPKKEVEGNLWAERIYNGEWATNQYGRKLFFKLKF